MAASHSDFRAAPCPGLQPEWQVLPGQESVLFQAVFPAAELQTVFQGCFSLSWRVMLNIHPIKNK